MKVMRQYRKTDMRQLSSKLNMEYSAKDEWGLLNLLTDFRLFKRGYGKRITNVLSHEDTMYESQLRIFDSI